MFGLAGAGQVVVLAWKENYLGGHAEMFEGTKPLLALFDRHPIVVIRMKNQCRSLDVLRILQRRTVPIQIHLLKNVAAEIRAVTIGAVTRAVVGNEIGNAAQCNRSFEPIRVANDPVGHIAAIATAGYTHPSLIDPVGLL